jgi:hypothetical protein
MNQDDMAWLSDTLHASRGVTVSITRGANTTASVSAVLGNQLLRVQDGKGQTKVERADRDFCIKVADYQIGGVAVEPQDGDIIALTLNGRVKRFEAAAVGSEASWRFSDEFEIEYRVHCKFRGYG